MKPMVSKEDLRAAQAIADWNTAHGSVLERVTAACGALEEACELALESPSDAAYQAARAAGHNLATVADEALRGPWAGIPQYDDPRRRGLECYREAGELAGTFDPTDERDENGEGAAALLFKGRQITSQATAFTSDLLRRVQHH